MMKATVSALIAAGLVYLTAAFVAWDFNAGAWPSFARLVVALSASCLAAIAFAASRDFQ